MAAVPNLYRGQEGMWMWVVHRMTGVGIFFFLLIHVVDTALVLVSPEAYNTVIATYKTPVYGLVETGLMVAIVFHAFNGLRVIAVDTWTWAARHQQLLAYVVLGASAVLLAGFLPRHLAHVFGWEF